MSRPIDIGGYLVSKLGARFRGENWRMSCPFCGADRDRFTVSIKKQVVHCWKCEYTNSVLGLVMELESVDLAGSFRIIKKYRPITYKKVPRDAKEVPLPSAKVLRYETIPKLLQNGSVAAKLARKYLASRGITTNETKFWKLGLSDTEKYSGYIISPFFDQRRLVYFVARRFAGSGPKYKNPSLTDWGVGKSELLFNYDRARARANDGITIVEGVYDVYASGSNAVALLGKQASSIQLSKIILANPRSCIIRLDADAKDEAYELAGILGELFPTKVIFYERGDPASNRIAPGNEKEMQYSFLNRIRNKLDMPTDY